MKFLTIIGSYIKTHVITTVIVGTVVVGGAVATPIIVNNINDNQNKIEPEVKEPNKQEEVETKTCEDGYELVDNECVEIKQEVEEPNEDKNTNNENTTNTNTNTNTSIPNNKPNSNKNNQNNNTSKPQENKPQESKPTCNDISCKITESNRVVYYEGKILFGIKVFQPKGYGYDVDGWQYNSSLIQSLSKEDRNYVFNNYFKKETYCATNPRTPSNCLKYSALEERLDGLNKGSNDEIYYTKQALTWPTNCVKYFQEGFIADGYNEDTMKAYCTTEYGNGKYETDLNDFQQMLNKSNSTIKLHEQSINECNSHKTAYQTTRSLLQQ